MPTNIPSFIIGYHGCDKDLAEKVLLGKTSLKVYPKPWDWLGSGIYFWENNPYRAYEWAKKHVGKKPANIKKPYAIGAIIDPGYCLDLTEMSSLKLVKDTYHILREIYGKNLPKNKQLNKEDQDLLLRNLDCFVINSLHIFREEYGNQTPFDTVRSPFFEGSKIYETSSFHEKAHIQLCVRIPVSIIGYFRILEKDVFKS